MGGVSIRPKLIKYFRERPGVQVYAEDITYDLGEDRKRIFAGINNMITEKKLPGLQRVSKGGPFVYNGPGQVVNGDAKELFQLIGESKLGDMILEGEDGKLYRAKELE